MTEPKFKVGQRVYHIRFDLGTVTEIEGNDLTVDFARNSVVLEVDGRMDPNDFQPLIYSLAEAKRMWNVEPPKRKVTKIVEGAVFASSGEFIPNLIIGVSHPGIYIPATLTYEVEVIE